MRLGVDSPPPGSVARWSWVRLIACGSVLAGSVAGAWAADSTGAAAGGMALSDGNLQACPETVGTVRLQDGMAAPEQRSNEGANPNLIALQSMLRNLNTQNGTTASPQSGASLDALRLLIQQSNCFVIVDRGLAAEAAADDEKRRTRSPNNEVRDDANMGPGQEVAADFVLRSTVISMGQKQSRGLKLGSLMPKVLGGGSVNSSTTEAKVQLVLSDVRSKVQIAVSQGEGSASNTSLAVGVLGAAGRMLGGGALKSESKTDASTILLQAFADAYNKLVPALQRYTTQTVKGGLGAGGMLHVQGARSEPSATEPPK